MGAAAWHRGQGSESRRKLLPLHQPGPAPPPCLPEDLGADKLRAGRRHSPPWLLQDCVLQTLGRLVYLPGDSYSPSALRNSLKMSGNLRICSNSQRLKNTQEAFATEHSANWGQTEGLPPKGCDKWQNLNVPHPQQLLSAITCRGDTGSRESKGHVLAHCFTAAQMEITEKTKQK